MATKKKPKIETHPLTRWVRDQITNGVGSHSDEVSKNRELSDIYYLGLPRGDENDDRSQVISMDLANMIEAVTASIITAFETDNVIEFEPEGEDDEKQARIESGAVNHFIMNENNGYVLIQEALRDALRYRNCVGKCWVEENILISTKTFNNLTELELYNLFETPPPQDTEIEFLQTEYDTDTDTFNQSVKLTQTKRTLKIKCIDLEAFIYSANHDSIYLDGIPFCADRAYFRRSDLVGDGYDKDVVAKLKKAGEDSIFKPAQQVRRASTNLSVDAFESSQEYIECYDCYCEYDSDGDGIVELHNIFLAGDEIINDEIVEFIPYFAGVVFLQPHRWEGLSLYDKLKQVQDVKTATMRQMLDNFENNNFNRVTYLEGMADLDALLSPAAGGAIPIKAIGAVTPLPVQDLGASSIGMLDYQDRVRTDSAGASLEMQTSTAQIMGSQSAAGGMAQLNQFGVKEQLAALMCRTFAETFIASMYRIVHMALRDYMGGQIVYRNSGQYQKTDASQWKERNRVNVKGGLSSTERARKGTALQMVLNQQGAALQLGQGVMVDLLEIYNAKIDMARCMGIDNPERYYTDPTSPQSIKAQEAQAKAQQQQAQQAIQQQQLFIEMQAQIETNKQAMEKHNKELDAKVRYMIALLDQDTEIAKMMGAFIGDIEKGRVTNAVQADATIEGMSDEQSGSVAAS